MMQTVDAIGQTGPVGMIVRRLLEFCAVRLGGSSQLSRRGSLDKLSGPSIVGRLSLGGGKTVTLIEVCGARFVIAANTDGITSMLPLEAGRTTANLLAEAGPKS